ncbi:helix-turn-helix transcriptional regulator [Novosphingobium sp. TCA1]|uniref:ArsR/SmtB family transcription factor n=1 Tax=Novosphingobium sp. TCA1 TaxID=2682474 RepID=UPI00130A84FA|nr:metalloregulator ArsR/SmtB family transcription factor [Novosphingobium sp. TCA1]GFE76348.1 hypothetical protein NTCA1_39970 [Novosphingobium sp. TCA1]
MDGDIAFELEQTAEVLRALAHPIRLQILHAIRGGQLSVGEIEEVTGIGQPGLSQQLSILRKAELVLSERSGKQVFYRTDRARLAETCAALAALGGPSAEAPHPTREAADSAPSGSTAPQGGAARFARVFR